jgi:hypothetical protein
MTSADFSAMIAALPGVEEGSHFSMRSWRCRKKALAGMFDEETIGLPISFDEREMLMEAAPEAFFITDHYRNYPRVLVRLSAAEPGTVKRLLMQAWRAAASKTMIAAFDAAERDARL